MNKIYILGLIIILGLPVSGFSQKSHPPKRHSCGVPARPSVITESFSDHLASPVVVPLPIKPSVPGSVSVLSLGTSANGLGWGYAGGQRTHIWADDDLKTIALIHRMGPGSSPPNLSDYLAVDKGINMGQSQSDWILNWQIYASNLSGGGGYLDMARFPQLAIWNSSGNSNPDFSYIQYFAPLVTSGNSLGNYTHGRANWGTQSDSTKHFNWFSPPPYHDTPDGFFVNHYDKAYVVDVDYNSATGEYNGNLIVGVGTLNNFTHDFQYTYSLIPLSAPTGFPPFHPRIASGLNDEIVWIACLGDRGGNSLIDTSFYPILFKSTDGGQSWSDPIEVTLDGYNGLYSVEHFISDYRLRLFYYPESPPPERDLVPYSTDYSCDMVIDNWGNPHIGVGIHIATGNGSVSTMDSTFGIFDIFTKDRGNTWCGRWLGCPAHFRGGFPYSQGIYEDNRVNASINEAGDHVFFTWLDSQGANDTANDHPDVFARGFNLRTCMFTNYLGQDNATNVTAGSAVSQSAWFADTPYFVFTNPDSSHIIIPVVSETVTGGNIITNPVSFNYIPDFSFNTNDYTIDEYEGLYGSHCWPPCHYVNIGNIKNKNELSVSFNPLPVSLSGSFIIKSSEPGILKIEIFNLLGKNLINLEEGFMRAGEYFYPLDVSSLTPGIYFYTVSLGNQIISGKIIIE